MADDAGELVQALVLPFQFPLALLSLGDVPTTRDDAVHVAVGLERATRLDPPPRAVLVSDPELDGGFLRRVGDGTAEPLFDERLVLGVDVLENGCPDPFVRVVPE